MLENGYKKERVFCRKVRVHETPSNSAWVEFTREGWKKELERREADDS